MMDWLSAEQQDVSNIAEKIGTLRARQEMRKLRLAQLSAMVGEAKARVGRQPKAQEFLERLQEISHEKSVGLYEELLSAVVQDVLPGEKNVSLTLKTSRGLPSLDIEMIKDDGSRESIMEGSGGALTNILSAGLRVIALARSGAYPFLVLDEPDCWLKPTRVPQFANVLGQIAEDLQIQVLLISHHEENFFSKFASQVKLERRGGVLEANQVGEIDSTAWDGAKTGIKTLRLFDFMSHEKTVIHLAPGVTCLTGENDIGKSAIGAALRALFYGLSSDSAIAHKKQFFKVEAEFFDGSVLSLERFLKKSPKQRWRYFVQGVQEAVQDASPKDGAPDWVKHIANIARTEDLDIAFANQKTPVFLLDQSSSRRASILAVGRESEHLQALIAKNKERNTMDAKMVRDGESEGASIGRELKLLESVDDFGASVSDLRREMASVSASMSNLEQSRVLYDRVKALGVALDHARGLEEGVGLASPVLDGVDSLHNGLRELGIATRIASLPVVEPSPNEPSLLGTRALCESVASLKKATRASKLTAPGKLPEAASLDEVARLGSLINLLGKARSVARQMEPKPVGEAPALLSFSEARQSMERLRASLVLVELSVGSLAAPIAPDLGAMEILSASMDLSSAIHSRLEKYSRLEASRKNKAQEHERKVKDLMASVGGSCPICSTPLDESKLGLGVFHHD